MTAKIKLNAASGGGSFSLQAPSSSSNNRVMTLPDTADGTLLTTTNPKSGNIIQVTSNNITSPSSVTFNLTAPTTTVITHTITSTVANSKFLISALINGELDIADHILAWQLKRTIGGSATLINVGDANGSNPRVTLMNTISHIDTETDATPSSNAFPAYLDSPSQSAGTAITYGFFPIRTDGINTNMTYYYGRCAGGYQTDQLHREVTPNYVTIMEVAP